MRFFKIAMSIVDLKRRNEVMDVLLNSNAASGPFDGGCLIFAKALQFAFDTGVIVRMESDVYGKKQAEHYGLALADGTILDADGPASGPEEWVRRFTRNEILDRPVVVVPGIMTDSDIPDDQHAAKELAKIIRRLLGRRTAVSLKRFFKIAQDESQIEDVVSYRRQWGRKGLFDVTVLKNPSMKDIRWILDEQEYGEDVGIILTEQNTYAFRRDLDLHQNVAGQLGLPEYVGVLYDPRCGYAMVSDATTNRYLEKPEAGALVRRMLPNVREIRYFNEDIVGPWDQIEPEASSSPRFFRTAQESPSAMRHNGKDTTVAVYESNQIKLADDVTFDDSENPIPLEQRFDPSNPDIRY
jgi:hypothetical protein